MADVDRHKYRETRVACDNCKSVLNVHVPPKMNADNPPCPICGCHTLKEIYQVRYICDNCGHEERGIIPRGRLLKDVPCPICGAKALRAA